MEIEFEKILKHLGFKIKFLRTLKGKTTKEIALKADIREKYLEKIESGKAIRCSLTQYNRIAEALEIELYKLFEDL